MTADRRRDAALATAGDNAWLADASGLLALTPEQHARLRFQAWLWHVDRCDRRPTPVPAVSDAVVRVLRGLGLDVRALP